MNSAATELLEAHRAYYAAWNQAFETKETAFVTAFISDSYMGVVEGEPHDAGAYRAGVEHAVKSTAGRWSTSVTEAIMRGRTKACCSTGPASPGQAAARPN